MAKCDVDKCENEAVWVDPRRSKFCNSCIIELEKEFDVKIRVAKIKIELKPHTTYDIDKVHKDVKLLMEHIYYKNVTEYKHKDSCHTYKNKINLCSCGLKDFMVKKSERLEDFK